MHRSLPFALLVFALIPASAAAQPVLELSLEQAVVRAVSRSPAAEVAAADVAVAEAGVIEARQFAVENPTLELAAGPRFDEPTTVDLEAGLRQPITLGGVRGAAVAVAEHDVEVEQARAAAARLQVAERAAAAYVRALHARRRLEIARASQQLAGRIAEIAVRRFEEGAIDRLQVNAARLAAGRLGIEVVLWDSRVLERLSELRVLLGIPPDRALKLSSTLDLPALPAVAALSRDLANVPELAALRAAAEREAARDDLGRAMAWPKLELGADLGREESVFIAMGVISLTLPVFARGQGVRAMAQARQQQVAAKLAARQRALQGELIASRASYESLRAAETAFRTDVAPTIAENDVMMQKAYEAGAVDLPVLLAMRAEAIAAKEAYADLLLEVARAAIHTRAVAGILVQPDTALSPTN